MIGVIVLLLTACLFGMIVIKLFKLDLEDNNIENIIITIGIGLGVFIFLSILFSLVGIPLHWITYAIFAIVFALLFKKRVLFNKKWDLNKTHLFAAIAVLFFVVNASIFYIGATNYPWLEDGDPWHHATITKYIAEEKTMFEPVGRPDLLKYADPYPASYGVLMAFVYQIDGNMIYTLKLTNAVLVALSVPFCYVFLRKLFKSRTKALLASAILLLTPCFLSHFIWSLTLAICLFFPTLYTLEKAQRNKKWTFIAAMMIGALMVTQPSLSAKLGIMIALYVLVKMIIYKNIQKHLLLAGLIGLLLSGLWWGTAFIRWGSPLESPGWNGVYDAREAEIVEKNLEQSPGWFRMRGTADRVYTFMDFFWVKKTNMINNPIGLGAVLILLVCGSILYLLLGIKSMLKKGEEWRLISLLWVLFTFLGIHGEKLPIQFIAFRFWMLFAISCAILVGGTVITFTNRYKVSKYLSIFLVLVGIVATSGIPKYYVNTAVWPPGGMWTNDKEMQDYMTLYDTIKPGTSVYPFCIYGTDKLISLGYDTCAWCKDEEIFRDSFLNKNNDEIYNFLKIRDYKYLIIDGRCVMDLSAEAVNNRSISLLDDKRFELTKEPYGMVMVTIK